MKKFLMTMALAVALATNSFAALTVGKVPVTKVGGTTPTLQDSPIAISGQSVGIGESSPIAKLHVEQTTNSAQSAYFKSPSTTGASYGVLIDAGTNSTDAALYIRDRVSANPLLRVTGAGNVGIGTASPSYDLHVVGLAGITGTSPYLALGSSATNFNGTTYIQNGVTVSGGNNGEYTTFQNPASKGFSFIQNTTPALVIDTSGDLYTNAWADYSSTSTIVGFSDFGTKQIYTKKIGKTVFVNFSITGTSNSGTTSFTLPYTPVNISFNFPLALAKNNGTAINGGAFGSMPGSATLSCYRDYAGTSWTTSGDKTVSGQFFYEAL